MNITVIINQMIQLFLVIALGYFLYKVNIFDDQLNKKFSTLLLSVTTPAMILASVTTGNNFAPIERVMLVSVITVAYFIIVPIFSYLIIGLSPMKNENKGLFIFMTIFSNVGFMGFPVISAIFGQDAIFYVAIFNLGFNFMIFSFGRLILEYEKSSKFVFDYHIFLTPGIICSILALVIYGFKITVPSVLGQTFDLVGGMTTPIAMLIIGSNLAKIPLKEVFNDIYLYIYTMIRQIIIPIIAITILKYLIQDEYIMGIIFVIIAMPVATSAVMFATEYRGDVVQASKSVFLTTLCSVVTIPLLVYFYLT